MVQGISTPGNYPLNADGTYKIDSAAGCEDVKTSMAVKLFKEAQSSQKVVGSIIQDTAQISAAAMKACMAERG